MDKDIFNDFYVRTIRMGHRLRRISRRNVDALGYNWNQFDILRCIKPDNELTVSEIAHRVVKSNSNITPILNYFEDEGLIERVRNKDDRRITRIRLTQKGLTERTRVLNLQRQYITKMLGGINTEVIEALLEGYEKIDEYLEDNGIMHRCHREKK